MHPVQFSCFLRSLFIVCLPYLWRALEGQDLCLSCSHAAQRLEQCLAYGRSRVNIHRCRHACMNTWVSKCPIQLPESPKHTETVSPALPSETWDDKSESLRGLHSILYFQSNPLPKNLSKARDNLNILETKVAFLRPNLSSSLIGTTKQTRASLGVLHPG